MSTNPPAFPTLVFCEEKPYGIDEGMSLRDYFAGQALNGYIAWSPEGSTMGDDFSKEGCRHIALVCYDLADAMLKAREAGSPS